MQGLEYLFPKCATGYSGSGPPDLDGQDILKELRSWSEIPVIVLSVRSDEQEKVTLLDAGANDYVTKPFSVQELMARIRVVLRSRLKPD